MTVKMYDSNQQRVMRAANLLINSVSHDESKIHMMIAQVDLLKAQVQNFLLKKVSSEIPLMNTNDSIKAEKARIAVRLGGFDSKENHVWEELSKRFGADIKRGELTNIAILLSETLKIKLDRDAKRRKCVLLKWFDENWEMIYPLLDYVILDDLPENREYSSSMNNEDTDES